MAAAEAAVGLIAALVAEAAGSIAKYPGRALSASALGEVLFGLIMVLTITLTARLTTAEDREGVAILLGG